MYAVLRMFPAGSAATEGNPKIKSDKSNSNSNSKIKSPSPQPLSWREGA